MGPTWEGIRDQRYLDIIASFWVPFILRLLHGREVSWHGNTRVQEWWDSTDLRSWSMPHFEVVKSWCYTGHSLTSQPNKLRTGAGKLSQRVDFRNSSSCDLGQREVDKQLQGTVFSYPTKYVIFRGLGLHILWHIQKIASQMEMLKATSYFISSDVYR